MDAADASGGRSPSVRSSTGTAPGQGPQVCWPLVPGARASPPANKSPPHRRGRRAGCPGPARASGQMLLTIRQTFPGGDPPLLIEGGDGSQAVPGRGRGGRPHARAALHTGMTARSNRPPRCIEGQLLEGIAAPGRAIRGTASDGAGAAPGAGTGGAGQAPGQDRRGKRGGRDPDGRSPARAGSRRRSPCTADSCRYVRQRRRTAALRQYELCRAALQRELGLEPEPLTRQLYLETCRPRRRRRLEPETATEWPAVRVPDAMLFAGTASSERLSQGRERACGAGPHRRDPGRGGHRQDPRGRGRDGDAPARTAAASWSADRTKHPGLALRTVGRRPAERRRHRSDHA